MSEIPYSAALALAFLVVLQSVTPSRAQSNDPKFRENQTVNSRSTMMFRPSQPPHLVLYSDHNTLALDIGPGAEGKYAVTFGPGMSDQEAAREFWRMVNLMAPSIGKDCKP